MIYQRFKGGGYHDKLGPGELINLSCDSLRDERNSTSRSQTNYSVITHLSAFYPYLPSIYLSSSIRVYPSIYNHWLRTHTPTRGISIPLVCTFPHTTTRINTRFSVLCFGAIQARAEDTPPIRRSGFRLPTTCFYVLQMFYSMFHHSLSFWVDRVERQG